MRKEIEDKIKAICSEYLGVEIEDKIKAICSEYLGVEIEKIKTNSDFEEDLGADSLDKVGLVMAFEEEFSIDITDEDAAKVHTVEDAVNIIEKCESVKFMRWRALWSEGCVRS